MVVSIDWLLSFNLTNQAINVTQNGMLASWGKTDMVVVALAVGTCDRPTGSFLSSDVNLLFT